MGISDTRKWIADYRPTKAGALWFGAGCAAATLVLGFGAAGWVTGGTAHTMAEEAAYNAKVEVGVAHCVDEFMQADSARARLEQLKKASWYERDELVANAGFATLPGEDTANIAVATQCAGKLAEMQPAQQTAQGG